MNFKYCLSVNLLSQNATELVFSLSKLPTTIYLQKENEKMVNGKSLLEVLRGGFSSNDIIKISIDNEKEIDNVKEIFNKFGKEI